MNPASPAPRGREGELAGGGEAKEMAANAAETVAELDACWRRAHEHEPESTTGPSWKTAPKTAVFPCRSHFGGDAR